jgi:ribonuclease-3
MEENFSGLNPNNVLVTKQDIEKIFSQVSMGIKIHNLEHYQRAFVHKSYCSKNKKNVPVAPKDLVPFQEFSNERDEYFGDGLLGVIVGLYLFERYDEEDEGFLTKMRTKIVNGKNLSELALKLNLQKYILISKHVEDSCAGRNLPSILENTLEAFISAIYQDQKEYAVQLGKKFKKYVELRELVENPHTWAFGQVQKFVILLIENFIDFSELVITEDNYKDILLKHFQKTYKASPEYKEILVEGPPHQRTFTISVHHINGTELGVGQGVTKREAQQNAAMKALQKLGIEAKYS